MRLLPKTGSVAACHFDQAPQADQASLTLSSSCSQRENQDQPRFVDRAGKPRTEFHLPFS